MSAGSADIVVREARAPRVLGPEVGPVLPVPAPGWTYPGMATHMRAELVTAALDAPIVHRRPSAGLVHHSDHGSQYTSLAFGRRLRESGIAASMGSVGDCYDNALAESLFATLGTELIDRSAWASPAQARAAAFEYI